MGLWYKVSIGLGAILILSAAVLTTSVVGTYNSFVVQENGLIAQYKQNQNNYSNYFNKLKEAAQVPSMQVEGLKKLYDGVMLGRYGKDGSKAAFQFIKESNPNLDSSMYVQLQRIIEAGRNSFESDQKALLDKKRVYDNSTQIFPGSIVASLMKFPTDKVKDVGIVTNAESDEAFKTKKAEPIKVSE